MNVRSAFSPALVLQAIIFLVISLAIVPTAIDAAESSSIPGFTNEHLALWLKADKGITKGADGLVQRWADQSGNQNDAIQTNPVSRPAWVKEAVHGQPVLRFDGVTNFFEIAHSSSLVTTGGVAIFAVVRVDDVVIAHNGIIGKTSSNAPAPFDFYLEPPLGQPRLYTGNGTHWSFVYGNSSVLPHQWTLVSAVVDATNQTTFLNGALNGSTPIGARIEDAGGSIRIGTRDDFEPWLKGDLAEILLVTGQVSDAQRTAIHKYLGSKYHIDVVLDVSVKPPIIQAFEGQAASFSAAAVSSYSTARYQWQKNGVDIPGATNAIYTTPLLTAAENNSNFRTRVSVAGTNRYSDAVTLQVEPDTKPLTVAATAFLQRDQSRNSSSAATPPPYSSRFWQTGEESSRNIIHTVTQTSNGVLWIGTAGGLARFDGEQFEFIPLDSKDRFARTKVNTLCPGKDGCLWVGTAGEGLFRLDGEKWISYVLPPQSDSHVLAISRTPDDSVWIGTRKGIALFKDERLSLRDDEKDAAPGPEKSPTTENVRSIAQDANGDLWIAAGDHLMRLRDGAVSADFTLFEFNPTYIRSVCYRKDGSVWMGCNSGLICFQDGKFTHFAKANGLPDNVVMVVFEDSRGNLWIGTSGGLCRFADGRFVAETTSDGEAYDQILCVFEDREKNLWVGAKNGLYQLRVQQFTTYTTRHGLAHNNVISIYEDRQGAMWIGTWGGGLHHLRDGKMTIYSSAKNRIMRNDLILAIQGASDGGLWFSTDFDGGLYRLKDGHVAHYGSEQGFGPTAVRALLEDSAGKLVIGTARVSVHVLENGKVSKYLSEEPLPSKDVRCLLQSQDGRVWIGTEGGLVCKAQERLSLFTSKEGLADNFILSLYEDKERILWIGTSKGLSRMLPEATLESSGNDVPAKQIFTSYTKVHGLSDDGVVEILEDDSENLWLATRQGVSRISRHDFDKLDATRILKLEPAVFGRTDGMISPVCVGVAKPSAWKSRDGRLWFATTKGVAVTDPQLKIEKNEVPPPVVIQGVVVNKKLERFKFEAQSSGAGSSTTLDLPAGNGALEFRYTALSYAAPEKNRFKYKLAGFDKDWVDAGTRRAAFYNSVPPGSYQFQVMACNNDGVWNSNGSSVKLTLQPHYWQTKWFVGLIALSSFGFVGGMARYVTWKRVRVKFQQLQQQHAIEKERTRIAEDMHDELGARLTEIRVLSDLTEKSKDRPGEVEAQSRRISNAAGELIRNLHSIVWAVNPANDSLEKLADYICGYAQQFLKGASIRCRLDRPDELPELKLPSEVRHNIVMVIKEALNNTIKHANASEVRISIAVNKSKLMLSVTDDGTGFSKEKSVALGNGLHNMEKRMLGINGRYELLTEVGKGTTIRFEIPLKDASAN